MEPNPAFQRIRIRSPLSAGRWTPPTALVHHTFMPETRDRTVLLLVGPKGAGKSTIGALLASELGVRFLRVEPLFLQVRSSLGPSHPDCERQGFLSVLSTLAEALAANNTVCLESTGASQLFPWFLSQLRRLANVQLIRVFAPAPLCAGRVRSRDTSVHIPVSDDQVERINALAFAVCLPWSLEIENGGTFDQPGIVGAVRQLLGRSPSTRGV